MEPNASEEVLDPMYCPDRPGQSFALNLYSWLQPILFALTVLILASTFLGRMIGVDGESMMPTLHDRDMLVLQSAGYTPEAGDVVVLTQRSYSSTPIVKRIIATGGQTVDIDYATGTVYVDGKAIDEPYLGEPMRTPTWLTDDHIEVPKGHVCVFGDNRNNSTDSRSPLIGTVDERCILGRAVLILMPFQRFGAVDK